MGAALDQESVLTSPDLLEAIQEVPDEVDGEVRDALKAHVLDRGALVAGSCRSERHQTDRLSILSRVHRTIKVNRTIGLVKP
jgi:hypothetical protein